ncbi:unnamed protein product, partial [Ectocarpus sp. 6 AP-2014]
DGRYDELLAHCEDLARKGGQLLSVADPGIKALHATSEGCTPLHLATEKGSPKAVRAFIEAGANPDRRTPTGVAPLHIAARSRRLDMLRELLRLKANPLLEFGPPHHHQ